MNLTGRMNSVIEMSAATDIGNVREQNEDYHHFSTEHNFFIVCDGMGGHEKGAVASKIAADTMGDFLQAKRIQNKMFIREESIDLDKACEDALYGLPVKALLSVAGVRVANRRLMHETRKNSRMAGMGTTIASAQVHDNQLIITHVGDSRIYRLRNRELDCLTTDHSWLNELIEDKEIGQEEIDSFQKKNVLTRALGIYPAIKIDLKIESIVPGDLYLICSDGLSNALSDKLIQSILLAYHENLQNKVNNLVNSAKLMDGSDNITAGLISVQSDWMGYDDNFTEQLVTIPEEPESVSNYFDDVLKTVYSGSIESEPAIDKKYIFAGILSACLLIFILLIWNQATDKEDERITQSALFSGSGLNAATSAPQVKSDHSVADLRPAGQLVLVQIEDIEKLADIASLEGVRILDTVDEFHNRIPLYTGRFTWALADSKNHIVYKNNNIMLHGVAEDDEVSSDKSGPSGSHGGAGRSENKAHIFLIGDFNADKFNHSTIYVNNKLFGPLSKYRDGGFHLNSGTYSIEIRNSRNKVLYRKEKIIVNRDESIALEF